MRDAPWFLLSALVIALDQLTKFLIRSNLSLGESIPNSGFVRLTHVTNSGGAFGLFAGRNFPLILAAAVGILVIFLYYRYPPRESTLLRLSLALMLGGAIGNLVDRLRQGYVTDFVDLTLWPVFNLADSSITIGVVALGYYLIFCSKDEPQSVKQRRRE
ncbi:MAG: signal peptidase II [Chloroflexi bacterium]|nr:signal peptidase II [Chloroflexota bacterium]